MKPSDMKETLIQLGLSAAAEALDQIQARAVAGQITYAEFLADILYTEQSDRRMRYLSTRTKLANLPFHKRLEDFDFSLQPTIDERQIRELADLSFIQEASNIFLLGPPGVGKSHLAVSLGLLAIEQGNSVYFTTAGKLVQELMTGYQEDRLRRRMRRYLSPKVLIIDEMGYQPFPPSAANLFFQLVSARYERSSIIITSNKAFGAWGEVLGDPVVTSAILDRMLHHSYVVNIRGDSYRLRERKAAGMYQSPPIKTQMIDAQA